MIKVALNLCSLVLAVFLTTQALSNTISNNEISISYTVSGKNITSKEIKLWERQLLTITINIKSDEEFSYIKELDDSIDGYKLESASQSMKVPGKDYFSKQLVIYLWPNNPGTHSLILKPVRLFLSGRTIKIINIPEITLDVQSLPSYLPPGFPVGRIQLGISFNSTSFFPYVFIKDQISSARYHVVSNGIHPDFIPAYFRYLKADSMTTLQSREINTGINNDEEYTISQIHEIPFVTTSNALVSVNEIKVSYFDPVESKIISHKTGSKKILSVNWFIYVLFNIWLLVLIAWTLKKLYLLFSFVLSRRRLWRAIIVAGDRQELTAALLRLLPISTIRKNDMSREAPIDLSCWSNLWRITALSPVVAQLNQINYASTAEYRLDGVKTSITRLLKENENLVFYLAVK